MPNTISLTAGLTTAGNGATIAYTTSVNITQSGAANLTNTQNIGTSTEAINLGDVPSVGLGYIYARNLDTGNLVMLGLSNPVSSGNAFAYLQPTEALVLPIRATGFFGVASGAACDVQIMAVCR